MMKGNSVKRGIGLARGEYVVVQDGDLEYDPSDLVEMLTVIRREDTLGVFGSRILGAKYRASPCPAPFTVLVLVLSIGYFICFFRAA